VVSYDLSRLSRSTKETLALVELAQAHGARVHVGDLGILAPDDPTGKLTLTTLAGANTFLRDMASKRAKEQVLARRAKGLPIGRPPYGGMPGEDAGAVIAAFDETGSYHAAARLLNDRGVPTRTGGLWSGKTIHQIVRRVRPGDYTARPRVRSRGRYILTGLLVCHCGTPMRVIGTRWNVSAVCGRGAVDPSHSRPVQISEAKLLPAIKAEVSRLRLPESVEMERATDDRRLQALAAKRERVIDTYTDGVIDKAERDRRLGQIEQEVGAIGARTVVVAIPAVDWTTEPSALNGVLRALFRKIDLGPDLMPVEYDWSVPEWRA
jgi:hypothetical protein